MFYAFFLIFLITQQHYGKRSITVVTQGKEKWSKY